jgi:hypothetical protein
MDSFASPQTRIRGIVVNDGSHTFARSVNCGCEEEGLRVGEVARFESKGSERFIRAKHSSTQPRPLLLCRMYGQ